MKLILTLLLILPAISWGACSNKVDPSKVILFIDTNLSDKEIETAQKAACERGEVLRVAPRNYKAYSEVYNAELNASGNLKKCVDKKTEAACQKETKTYIEATKRSSHFLSIQPTVESSIKMELDQIRREKGKIQNITISGHDGGGNFGGLKGSYDKWKLAKLMKGYQDINDVKSILLLGCYTAVQKEVMDWKTIFPNARLIGGYDLAGPLADRPAGHQYLHDLLTKEKKLVVEADEKKLSRMLKSGIGGINMVNAAVYVSPVCEDKSKEKEDYYYASENTKRQLVKLDLKKCMERKKEIEDLIAQIKIYESGEKEPPLNTQGEIRAIYNKSRGLEHCGKVLNLPLDVNKIFFLLFYHDTKKNFANFYKQELAEAQKMIANFKPINDSESLFETLKEKIMAELPGHRPVIAKIDPEEVRSIWIPTAENLATKTRKELLENQHKIHKVLSVPTGNGMTMQQQNVLRRVSDLSAYHLQNFRNPFSWHEYTGKTEAPVVDEVDALLMGL